MSLDVKLCLPKITTLYNSWKTERSKFENSDSLIFIRGKNQEEAGYSKSTSFQLWLFGYELPEMVAVFGEKSIVFLASSKKAAFLEPLKKAAADVSSDEKIKLPEIQILTRSKGDQDAANFESIANMIKGSFDGKAVGLFTKEVATHTGPFAGSFIASLSKFQKVNAAAGTGIHMAIKDKQDLTSVRGAASLSSDILHKFLRRRITESVDDPDKSPTHSSLAESALAYFVPDAKDEKLKYINKHKLEVGDVDSCYTPIVQSGKKFSLKVSAQSDESILASSGAIMCTLGARYNFHCSNVGRTFIFDPSDEQRKNYEMLISCYEEAIPTMRPGKKLSATLDKVKAILKEKKRSDLEVHLPKSLGFCMTYEFRESALAISAKCSERYAENMVFNLAIGFENLPFKGDKSKPYALQIVDTVLITSEDPEVLTTNPKKWDDIAWDLQGDDEEDKEIEEDDSKARLAAELLKTDKFTGGRRSAKVAQDDSNEARKAKQKELEAKVNEAAKRRLLNQVDEKTNSQLKKTVACFKNRKDMNSEESRKLKIWIDKTAHAGATSIWDACSLSHLNDQIMQLE